MRTLLVASLAALYFAGWMALYFVGCNSPRRADGMERRLANVVEQVGRLETLRLDAARVSHERREALADGLRREIESESAARWSDDATLTRQVAGLAQNFAALRQRLESQVAIRGQQIAAERSRRRKEIVRLADELAGFAFAQVTANAGLIGRLEAAERRLKALESRPPVVRERTRVEVPVHVPVYPAPVPIYTHPVAPARCR